MPLSPDPSTPLPATPALAAFEQWFGTRIRVQIQSTGCWWAELHDLYDGYAFRVTMTGATREDAIGRVEKWLREVWEAQRQIGVGPGASDA